MSVTDARLRWEAELPKYEALLEVLSGLLRSALSEAGILAAVTARPKEVHSLLKKLLTKQHHTYESLPDKAGVRIVVAYRAQVEAAAAIVRLLFHQIVEEDKVAELGVAGIGYQGHHFDVLLGAEAGPDFSGMRVEIQVLTKAQNLWADMQHDTAYKTTIKLPVDIVRRFNLLTAALEMADREFENLDRDISALPNAASLRMIRILEKCFIPLNPTLGDYELSVIVVDALSEFYDSDASILDREISEFCTSHRKKLRFIFDELKNQSPFMSQPEVLMILDLLEKDEYSLKDKWRSALPMSELEELAVVWGKPIS